MSPGITTNEEGERRIRIMKGLEMSTLQLVLTLIVLGIMVQLPDIATLSGNDPIQLNLWQLGLALGMAALGLNILLRHAELVSFGHAAFFGTGAYAVALTVNYLMIKSVVVLFVITIVAAIVISAFIGYFTLEHTGLYFALVTLAFGQVLWSIAKGFSVLGGTDGMNVKTGAKGVSLVQQKPSLFGLHFAGGDLANTVLFWMSLFFVVVGLLVMLRISKSPFGRALDAIGQQRTRAKFLGLPVKRYVWAAFIISGIYAAIGGFVYALAQGSVTPANTLNVFVSGDILYMAILGGFDTVLGPVVGGLVFENLTFLADQVTVPGLTDMAGRVQIGDMVTGIVFIFIVFAFPEGIMGTIWNFFSGDSGGEE